MGEEPKCITLRLFLITFIINIIIFASGASLGWTSPYLPKLKGPPNTEENPLSHSLTPTDESWISCLLGLGSIFSPILFSYLADQIGRKNTLICGIVPLILSFIIITFSTKVYQFCIARFLAGIGAGCGFTVVPFYVGELAEDSIRGALSCVLSVANASGYLLMFILGPMTTVRISSLIFLVPTTLFIVLMIFFVPESPYFLVSKNKFQEAEKALQMLRGKNNDEAINTEIDMIETFVKEFSSEKRRWADLLSTRGLKLGIGLVVGLMVFQEVSGINAVLCFLQDIFDSAGTSLTPENSAIVIGCVQLFANLITPTIIDRLGRRMLYFASTLCCTASEFILGTYFYLKNHGYNVKYLSPIACLVVFIIGLNLGLGPMPFIMIGEIFPNDMKSKASMIANVVGASGTFVTTLIFPYIISYIGIAEVFWIFSGCCALAFVFAFCLLPETKGKSFIEIQREINKS